MGPLDRIMDSFSHGTKRAAVRQIFDAITRQEPAACRASDTLRRLERFGQLRALADPGAQRQFLVKVNFDKRAGTWGVAFQVADITIHCCSNLLIADTSALKACLDAHLLCRMTRIFEAKLPPGKATDTEDLLTIAAGPAVARPDEADPDAYLAARIGQCVRGLPPSLRCEFSISPPPEPGTLAWRCTLADECLYEGTLPLTAAQDACAAARLAVYGLETMLERAFAENASLLLDQNAFVEGCLECMTDDRAQRAALRARLDDPELSSANLRPRPRPLPGAPTFQVEFGNTRLDFSNRSSGMELRGGRLWDRLHDNEYANLREAIASAHLSEDDTQLIIVSTPAVLAFVSNIENLPLAPTQAAAFYDHAARLPLGNTRLGRLHPTLLVQATATENPPRDRAIDMGNFA